jgi:hypothetical protein
MAGAGLYDRGSSVTLVHTILAGNVVSGFSVGGGAFEPDCSGEVTSLVANLFGSDEGCAITGPQIGDRRNVNARLEALADNGGFVLTHAPMATSPALEGGPRDPLGGPGDASPLDARRVARPQGSKPDIGAVEECWGSVDFDADTIPDECDNCPVVANRQLGDRDGDGIGDACDTELTCVEPSALDRRPGVPPLRVTKGSGGLLLTWEPILDADVFAGTLASLAGGLYDHAAIGACRVTVASATIPTGPDDAYFLVAGHCGAAMSSLGRDSFGIERPGPLDACP